MKTLAVILVLVMTLGCYAQTATNAEKKPGHFYWSASKAKEIPLQKTLAHNSGLSVAERHELFLKIFELVKPFDENDIKEMGKKEFEKLVWKTRVELVDLNGDNEPEIMVQASDYHVSCGATGNCAFWIFKKTPNGFKLILDTRDKDGIGGIEYYTITNQSSYGYNDLVFAAHVSSSEKYLQVYKFNGETYQPTDCYDADWVYWKKDGPHTRKNPIITVCKD